MSVPTLVVHYERQEELLECPMYPSLGVHATLQDARDSTAYYLRAARRMGASISVITPSERKWDGEEREYLVHTPERTIVVVLDASEATYDYHARRQTEIGAQMRARGEIE